MSSALGITALLFAFCQRSTAIATAAARRLTKAATAHAP